MKTQQEIEKMKAELVAKISVVQDKINNDSLLVNHEMYRSLKTQYMAQYNILLEVLK